MKSEGEQSSSSVETKVERGETRNSLEQILEVVLAAKKPGTSRKHRIEFLKALAERIKADGHELQQVPEEFKLLVLSKLMPKARPKSMTDEAFEEWREDALRDVEVSLSNTVDAEPPPQATGRVRRTAQGTDIWRILQLAEEALNDPSRVYGPLHAYKSKHPDKFEKNREELEQRQTKYVVTSTAKSIRGLWPYLDAAERKQYAWLAPGRSDAEIVADFKSGRWRDETATKT